MNRSIVTYLKANKGLILIAILIIFYTVGTVGILLPEQKEFFLSLSFFNLLLSFSIVLLTRERSHLKFIGFLILCYFTGMTAEWIGTKTGLLFGEYSYGNNLGAKWSGVPLVIGINWGILVVTSASLISRLKLPVYIAALLSSLLMTFLDVLMEPVAIESDFWNWTNGEIPLYNYVCWFLISLPLHVIYFKFKLSEPNKVFDSLFIILTLFFTILNIF
jgi:putative membrane protein